MTIQTENLSPVVSSMTKKKKTLTETDSPLQSDEVASSSKQEKNPVQNCVKEQWPEVFYCQRSHILMTDPVVGPDGNSIDRSSLKNDDTNTVYYPNRALQAILQETMTLRNEPFRASLKHFQQSVSQGICHLLPETTANEPLFRPLNDAFYCPITFNLMHEPVIDPEGNTFERVAVENWIRVNQNSPITRTELSIDQLYPNTAIQKLLQEEKEKPEDQMHPMIRKWKDEPAPKATDLELGGRIVMEQEQREERQGQQQGTTVLVITTTNGGVPLRYPTTPSEWSRREDARRRSIYQFFGIFFAGVCLTAFVLYGSIFFLMLFVITLFMLFSKNPTTHR